MFRPNQPMNRVKANLHRACPPDKAVTLTFNDPSLPRFISPTPLMQIRKWLEKYGEEFWEWFVTPPQSDGQELYTRELAYEALTKILSMDIGEDAEVNVQVARLQMDAAKLLLGSRGPMIAIQNNNGVDSDLPIGLKSKSPHQLAERLHNITKHLPNSMELEGEIESK